MSLSHRPKNFQVVSFLLRIGPGFLAAAYLGLAVPGSETAGNEPPSPGAVQTPPIPSYPPLADSQWNLIIFQAVDSKQNKIHVRQAQVSSRQIALLPAANRLGHLKELLLDAGQIDDPSLEAIARACPQLEHLRLRLSPLGDHAAPALARLKQLRVLNLPHSRLTSEGIAFLRELPHLESVRLGGARIDDLAVAELAALPALESLHLIGPKLTEQALQSLAQAPKLTSFYLDDCSLSSGAWQKLSRARPDLHVHLDQPHLDR